jgi:hypothetical protein
MDDSFRLRVEKTFGSLATAPPASTPPSLWSLTDDEIEKREWNRGKQDDADEDQENKSYPSNLDGFFKKSLDDDDEDVNDKSSHFVKPDEYDEEEWDIRSSVGLDCTLDNEEEEDGYDKVAIGDERTGDYLFMGDVVEQKNGIHKFIRGSNHLSAKFTVEEEEEDVETAGNFNALRVSQDNNIKSILKKRGNSIESKTGKRVRFDPECKDEEVDQETIPEEDTSLPEYLRNPLKYTRYTFDNSSDINEESNRKACMDFLNTLRGENDVDPEDDIRKNPPKTVIFTPKKRVSDDSVNKLKVMEEDVCKEENSKLSFLGDISESEACAMEEDDEQVSVADNINSISSKKGRQYRVKPSSDDDEAT